MPKQSKSALATRKTSSLVSSQTNTQKTNPNLTTRNTLDIASKSGKRKEVKTLKARSQSNIFIEKINKGYIILLQDGSGKVYRYNSEILPPNLYTNPYQYIRENKIPCILQYTKEMIEVPLRLPLGLNLDQFMQVLNKIEQDKTSIDLLTLGGLDFNFNLDDLEDSQNETILDDREKQCQEFYEKYQAYFIQIEKGEHKGKAHINDEGHLLNPKFEPQYELVPNSEFYLKTQGTKEILNIRDKLNDKLEKTSYMWLFTDGFLPIECRDDQIIQNLIKEKAYLDSNHITADTALDSITEAILQIHRNKLQYSVQRLDESGLVLDFIPESADLQIELSAIKQAMKSLYDRCQITPELNYDESNPVVRELIRRFSVVMNQLSVYKKQNQINQVQVSEVSEATEPDQAEIIDTAEDIVEDIVDNAGDVDIVNEDEISEGEIIDLEINL